MQEQASWRSYVYSQLPLPNGMIWTRGGVLGGRPLTCRFMMPGRVAWKGQICSRSSRVQKGHCDSVKMVTFTTCARQCSPSRSSAARRRILK